MRISNPCYRGFSLIELLTTMAVLTVLVAVLLPTMSSARKKVQTAKCSNNLKQLISAWQLYCGENNGSSISYSPSLIDSTGQYTAWPAKLLPYLPAGSMKSILLCPSASTPGVSSSGTASTCWKMSVSSKTMYGSYGLNSHWYSDPQSFGVTPSAAYYMKILQADPNNGPVFGDATWIDTDRINVASNFLTANTGYAIARHNGKGVNLAFSDGSVRFYTMGDFYTQLKLYDTETINPAWINSVPAQYR